MIVIFKQIELNWIGCSLAGRPEQIAFIVALFNLDFGEHAELSEEKKLTQKRLKTYGGFQNS